MKGIVLMLAIGILARPTAVMRAQLQTASAQTQFDVVSIKLNQLGRGAGLPRVASEPGRFVASNAPLKMLLQFAYRPSDARTLRNSDIFGAPDWADADRFDVEAKFEGKSQPILPEQMRLMVQSLLAERFQLSAHWETRDMPVYNLMAKDLVKIKLSPDQAAPTIAQARVSDPAGPPPRGTVRTLANPLPSGMELTLSGNAVPIETLVNELQLYMGRPVRDKTALTGLFDIRLQFHIASRSGDAGGTQTTPLVAPDPAGPDIFAAIQDQLGLKVESARAAVEVLVVDRVQKPSEN